MRNRLDFDHKLADKFDGDENADVGAQTLVRPILD
jgi:hypothetical protein